MPFSEFEPYLSDNLKPIRFDPAHRPSWAAGIPEAKIHSMFVSGSEHVAEQLQNTEGQIGGFEVWRHAEEKDGVNLNKDHYYVVKDPDDDTNLFVFGPFKEDPNSPSKEHHLDDLPKRLRGLVVQRPILSAMAV